MNWNKGILLPEKYDDLDHSEFIALKYSWFQVYDSILRRSGLAAQSFDYILTTGVFETESNLRDFIKKLDVLLREGATLVIRYNTSGDPFRGGHYIRPISFLMYEISLSFGKRYHLINKEVQGETTVLSYKKVSSSNKYEGLKPGWSFGIVSDGKKDARIKQIVDQIISFNIDRFEILICGPKPEFRYGDNVKVLDDSDLYCDIRIPITGKKNRIVFNAEYENIVIIHDRISFSSDWYLKMLNYGNYFEVLANKILDEDRKEFRVQDWVHHDKDFYEYQSMKPGLLRYEDWNPFVYIDGGFLIAKTLVLRAVNGYNDALYWGEAEDVDLSFRLYQAGFIANIDVNNTVYTQTHRHKGARQNDRRFDKKAFLSIWFDFFIRRLKLLRERKAFFKYLESEMSSLHL